MCEDMRDAARKILDYTKDMTFEDFLLDDKTIDAAVRNFEIIGEAARRVPANFKIGHPEIEWHRITGLRNRIIHEYFGVDYKTHICHKIQMCHPYSLAVLFTIS